MLTRTFELISFCLVNIQSRLKKEPPQQDVNWLSPFNAQHTNKKLTSCMIVQVQPYTHAYKHICTQKLPQNAALIGLIDLCVTGLKVVVISELPVGVLCYTEL